MHECFDERSQYFIPYSLGFFALLEMRSGGGGGGGGGGGQGSPFVDRNVDRGCNAKGDVEMSLSDTSIAGQ